MGVPAMERWPWRQHGGNPSGRPPVPHVALAPNRARSLCLALLAVIARIAYIAAEVALVAAPSL